MSEKRKAQAKPKEGRVKAGAKSKPKKAVQKKKAAEKPAVKAKTGDKKEKAAKETKKPKEAKEVKKKAPEKKKPKQKKPKELLRLIEKIKRKKKPVFRGRFGKKWMRKKSKEKWAKWRKPRGIDIKRNKEDGAIPSTGYRTEKRIRAVHPSGFREMLVRNMSELDQAGEGFAVRIASGIGKRKRKEIAVKAREKGVKLLN